MPGVWIFIYFFLAISPSRAEQERRLQISEDAQVGTVVGRILDMDTKPSNEPVLLFIFPPESQVEQTFSVDDRNGEIKTKKGLDYETKTSYVFLAIPVHASSPGSGDGIRVTIEVLDVNDCAPEFPEKRIELQISEYSKVGSETPLPAAIDRDDSEQFGVQKYELISGNVNNAFRLGVRHFNRLLYADLIVNSELDRELLDHYTLEIRALDGGDFTDTLHANVTILDANDNAPIFDKPRYAARLASNWTVGMEVIRVHADDKDSGDNGHVDYRLLPSPLDAQRWFRIDGTSGRIMLARSIDQQQSPKQFELFVSARDRGYPQPLETTSFVTVTVVDLDAHKPEIKVIYLSDDGRPLISEAAEIGSLVARVSVSDPDTHREFGNGSGLSVNGDDDTFGMRISSDAVYVLLKRGLDRETRANYSLTLQAKIGETAYQRSVVIKVADVNDNAPQFKQALYEAEIKEKSTPGTSVLRVEAVDADEGENGAITYSFAPSTVKYSKWLDIDQETGLITTADTIDCEISSRPEFTIVATDHGKPALSSTAKLTLTVLDVNDNPPSFLQSLYNVTVREDADIGYCFLPVQAVDPDCGVNAQIQYKITTDGTAAAGTSYPFDVDKNTGNVCLTAKLDYERRRNFQFPVFAYDGGGLYASTMVILAVEDVNDNGPVFYPEDYNATVRQYASPGALVVVISAADDDEGQFGVLTYSIVSGNEEGKFRIEKTTGYLLVDQNFAQVTNYQLTIQATDGGGLTAVHPATVSVIVSPDQSPIPEFTQSLYRFTVREDTLPGIAIGTVHALASNSVPINYKITAGNSLGNFTIDHRSGSISIVHYLDHEVKISMLLNIQASTDNPTGFNYTQVEVIIEDVNDNQPVFERRFVHLNVPEDHSTQRPIFVCYARDEDSGKNKEVRYRLISTPGSNFMVHPISGEVRLTQQLDYELQKNYTLTIFAQDGGIPPLSDNMTLEISILDVNDHNPTFGIDHYQAMVSEDAAPMTPVIQVHAIDLDTGVNGQITYRLESSPGGASEVLPFRVFADSGWIYVRHALDREMKKEYSFTVVATDHGQPSRYSTVPIVITVTDVNDHAPDCQSIQDLSILENRPSGTLVGRVAAADPDDGENGTVTYSVTGSPANWLFRLTPNGELYTESMLDRENQSFIDLNIIASDAGSSPLSSLCSLRITILDENDHAPVLLLPTSGRLYFREEQPKGSEVAQIRASDPDNGENGTVKYSLESRDPNSPFIIDPVTGVISSTAILDYESGQRKYELAVIAEDLGKPPRSSKEVISIEILDIDDGGASSNDTFTLEVSESAPVGYVIGPVDTANQVTDLDVITDAEKVNYSYEIVSGNNQGVFHIDPISSTLRLIGQLDYETNSAHFLIVKQHPQPRRSKPVEIRVKVLVVDENDNAPTFNEDPVVFSVPENKAGITIWRFNATDMDMGSLGRVEYRIIGQYPPKEDLFPLDSISGELVLKKELDYEQVPEYLLLIEATDQAPNVTQRRSGRVTTRIYVTDINDNDPRFVSRDHANVFTDTPLEYPFMYVAAVDGDGSENGRVTYRITTGNEDGLFQLDTTSGALSLTKPLNRGGGTQEHRLTIIAEDHGIPQRTARQVLTVHVQDSDNSMRFEQSIYRVNVSENGPSGVVVAQLRARSPERGNAEELLYVLLNGTASNKFRINEKTGSLSTTGPLDREEIDEYVLTVYARYAQNSPVYDVVTVIVKVDDVNDNAPRIAEATCLEQSVPENKPFQAFHSIIASDADVGENGRLNFDIIGGNADGKFRINASTGEIGCDALDRETTSTYNLTVQVRDSGSSGLSTQCSLSIRVLDENDNSPHFEQSSYLAQIPENTSAGTTVLKLTAIDLDDGLNGNVMYTIANETAGLFEIGANSGEIVVIGKLDYEQGSVYNFAVKAYDQSPSESRWDEVRVTIQILDVNDNAPVFTNVPFIANVSSSVAAGQRVVKVVATDADGPGPNSEIAYSLSNSEDTRFVINPMTGVISAKQTLQLTPSSIEYLNIVATDRGDPPQSTTSVVEIVVDPSEESARRSPAIRFSQPSYVAQITEDAANGTEVIKLATSTSSTLGDVQYKIISGNERNTFFLEGTKGTLLLSDPSHLDYETIRLYQLVVEAKAAVKTQSDIFERAFVSVQIDVLDANDHAPQFLQQRYSANVLEGKSKGAFVIQVSATDGDIGENAALTYSIVSGNVDSAFVVDNGGIVKTNAELDREIHDHYTLTVMAVDAGSPPKSGTAIIDVLVMDINDNSPSFPAIRPLKISEGTEVGSLLAVVTANDVDTFPPLVYSMSPASQNVSEYFNLDRFTGRLVLAREIDYEKDHSFDVEIQVSDGVYVASTRQSIIVLDENDNAPVFDRLFYQAVLLPGQGVGGPIAHVSAMDLDSGVNGRVRYAFLGPAAERMGFWIHSETGEIFLNRTVSELPSIIQLTVLATDHGRPRKLAQTALLIQLGQPSEKRIDFSLKVYSFTVSENAPIHGLIGRITTTTGNNSNQLRFVIKSGDPNRTFTIDTDGHVVLMRRLDRESVDPYSMDLALYTEGTAMSNSTARLLIQVLDVNDNAPLFDEEDYRFDIHDSLLPGAIIGRLNAMDLDSGDNGTVSYQLMSGDAENLLEMDPQTGTLTLRRSTSAIYSNEFRLFVRASDNGSPARSTICGVRIRIQNENLTTPFFPVQRYIGLVPENAPVGAVVLKVKAVTRSEHQKKTNVTTTFKYSIMGGHDERYQLDPSSGELKTIGLLDFEEKTNYRLSIIVSDDRGHWSNTTGYILVQGVDEFAPVFAQNQFTFHTTYDAVEGEPVGAVSAIDRDAGIDGKVNYAIKDDTPYFRIHPESGAVSVAASLAKLKQELKPENDGFEEKAQTGGKESKIGKKDIHVVFLTVIAYSGLDASSGRVNSTKVEIQISRFSRPVSSKFATTSAIISISIALILLLIVIIVFVMVKLRRRDNKPSLIHQVKGSKRGKKNRQLLKTNDVIQPCSRAASRAACGFYTTDLVNGNSLKTESGRNSLRVEGQRKTPSLRVDGQRKNSLRVDGPINIPSLNLERRHGSTFRGQNEECGSSTPELPSTREYLTSLGVEVSSKNTSDPDELSRRNYPHGNTRLSVTEEVQNGTHYSHREDQDVQDLIYSKVNEVLASENDTMDQGPSMDQRPRSVRHDSNGRMDFDVTDMVHTPVSWPGGMFQNAAPSYQPLTQVFSEIVKIKNDTLKRRQERSGDEENESKVHIPRSLHVDGSSNGFIEHNPNGVIDQSPTSWAPTDFASPEDPRSVAAYAISENLESTPIAVANGTSGGRERRSVAELEIKI